MEELSMKLGYQRDFLFFLIENIKLILKSRQNVRFADLKSEREVRFGIDTAMEAGSHQSISRFKIGKREVRLGLDTMEAESHLRLTTVSAPGLHGD